MDDPGPMNYKVRIREEADHTRMTITGQPTIDELLSLFHVIGVQSEDWSPDVLLLDLRGVTSRYPQEQEFRVGQEIVTSLSHMKRIASVVPTDRITRLAERAARRSVVSIRVFDDEALALDWLREPAAG